MWKISIFGCFLLIATVVKNTCGRDLPADIEKCIYGDGKCLMDRINYVYKNYPHGIPEFSVPDLNPLRIDAIDVNQDSSKSVALNIKMRDLEFVDFHKIRFYNNTGFETGDWNNTVFTFHGSSPVMTVDSKYTINGKILVLPIEGSGDMHMVVNNPKFAVKLKMITQKKDDGKTYATIDKLKLKTTIENMTIQMDNLFNGEKGLGDHLNKVMNENWNIIWDEVEPAVDHVVAQKIRQVMNSFFSLRAIEDVFIIPK